VRIVLVCPILPPKMDACGDGTDRLAREFVSRGDAVLVISDADGAARSRPYRVASVGARFDLKAAARALRETARFDPDAAFVQYTPFLYRPESLFPILFTRGVRQAGTPLGIYAHECFYSLGSVAVRGRLKQCYLSLRDAAVFKAASCVFAPTAEKQQRISARLPATKTLLMPVGANVEPAEVWAHRTPQAPFRLLTFGVVMPRRRIELGIRALALLREAGVAADLNIAGRVWDSSYVQACTELAAELGVLPSVRFLGSLSPASLSAEFFAADLCLHTAVEGAITSSGALLAALAHGLPTIAARTAHDEACFARAVVFAEPTAADLANACARLLADRGAASALAISARRLYDDCFGWGRIASAIESALSPLQPCQAAV